MRVAITLTARRNTSILVFLLVAGLAVPSLTRTTRATSLTRLAATSADETAEPAGPECMGWAESSWQEREHAVIESKGVDVAPMRCIADPYPTFNGIALDTKNNVVVMSDTNRKSLLVYDRAVAGKSLEETKPLKQIMGPKTQIGFIAGVALDTDRREIYAVNNDIEDTMAIFSYDDEGNLNPRRLLAIPHQAYAIGMGRASNEIALTVQSLDAVVFYRREASGVEAPLRSIIGSDTGLADPHGLYIDEVNKEVVVASHGNWGEGDVSAPSEIENIGGRFEPPSIRVFPGGAQGNVKPLRAIAGPNTKLNWPMQIAVDAVNNEIAVANNGDNSVLIFRRTDSGDVAPVRVIRGRQTGIDQPMAVAIDTVNNEIWVANFGDHTALVFDRRAKGNASPKRIIRNAPAGTPTIGFGNPMAVAYDTRRQEILVPN
jgi:DNA-binding beta-propeller fold protein YncE